MAAYARTGWLVFIVLIALVLLEYVVFLAMDMNMPLMVAMNVADAALIVWYFMHVSRLWRREEKGDQT
jgi:hypothetical protein